VDCQYQYLFVGDSDYHGFLSHHTGKRFNPLVEKRVIGKTLLIADFGLRIEKSELR